MKYTRTNTRYAHSNGFTYCTYSEDGKSVITCGSDGDVRIWQEIKNDPISKCIGESAMCVLQRGNEILTCTDVNMIYRHTFPEMNPDGIEFRFTAMATCIKFNEKFLAAGSEDTKIKVTRAQDKNEFELNGHEGPILHISLNQNNLLASSSGDGTIKIWDLDKKEEIKTINEFQKVTTFERAECFVTPCFNPKTNNYLAYCQNNEVIVINCKTWKTETKLKHESIEDNYSCCAFSSCGQFIAAGTVNGKIIVFDLFSQQPVTDDDDSVSGRLGGITSIAWNPNNTEFMYCDNDGYLGKIILKNKNENKKNDYIELEAEEVDDELGDDLDLVQFEGDGLDESGDDDDDGSTISINKLKQKVIRSHINESDKEENDDDKDYTDKYTTMKTFTQQEPFQPGATPEESDYRYLVWNNIGIVRACADDDAGSIIVEFHDANLHHNIHMRNYDNHTMASLSSSAVILSSTGAKKLVCISLGASEWSIELPDCEGITAIVATNEIIAVATDNRVLRIFSALGTQREVISIPGTVVSMCGYENKLMIAFHSAPASNDQHISAILLQMYGLSLISREIRIPLAPGKKLTWIGFSDCGSPVCNDTMGQLKMYNMKSNCWYPICDTMKHVKNLSDNFYVINVLESSHTIQGVICHGCMYPMTKPRPIVSEIPMKIPLCDIESNKSEQEEALIRHSNFPIQNSDVLIKESAMTLFALACRTEMEARAKELIEMIASPDLLSLAIKYASKLGRIHLADKLSEILPDLQKREKEREKQIKEADTNVIDLIQNSSLGESLMLRNKSKAFESTSTLTPSQIISPKQMSIVKNKSRNPFKTSSTANTTKSLNRNSNPLSHLTEKIISCNDKMNLLKNSSDNETIDSEGIQLIDKNKPSTSKTKDKSIEYNDKLDNINVDIDDESLRIDFMNSSDLTNSNSNSNKRKLTSPPNEKQSGISKLSKYTFEK